MITFWNLFNLKSMLTNIKFFLCTDKFLNKTNLLGNLMGGVRQESPK